MATRKLRIYEGVWEKLKKDGKAFITAKDSKQKARIIKGVIKEKYQDDENKFNYEKLEYKIYPHGINFILNKCPSIKDF